MKRIVGFAIAAWCFGAQLAGAAPLHPIPAPCDGCAMALDGVLNEPVWGLSSFQAVSNCSYVSGCGAVDAGAAGQYKLAWDNANLWIGVSISDPGVFYANAAAPWNGSGVEIFLDLNDTKGATYDANSYQWTITYDSSAIVQYHNPHGVTILASSQVSPGTGYTMEIQIPWANLGLGVPAAGTFSGFDIAFDVSNAGQTGRDHQVAAFNAQINPFDTKPSTWGDIGYLACVVPSSPTPVSAIAVTLRVYDPSGALVQQQSLPSSDHLIQSATLGSSGFDPMSGALSLSSGDWSASFQGKNSQGYTLSNGVYMLEIVSGDGSSSATWKGFVTVLSQPDSPGNLLAAPNPVLPGQSQVLISWSGGQVAEVRIYDGSGALIRVLGPSNNSSCIWDMRSTSGQPVSAGTYLALIRPQGQGRAKILKIAVAR
jgi:hypothetical protein